MVKAMMAIKLDKEIARKFKAFCKDRGLKYGFFIEEAIKQKMELEELKDDVFDLKTLQPQEKLGVPLQEYLRKRGV